MLAAALARRRAPAPPRYFEPLLEPPAELPVPLLPGALLPDEPGLEGDVVPDEDEPAEPPVALLPPGGAVEPGLPLVRGLLP